MEKGSAVTFWALVLWFASSSQEMARERDTTFYSKVAQLLKEEPENPKCFTEHLEDLACFWETSEHQAEQKDWSTYSLQYKYEEDSSLKICNLTVENTSRSTTSYTCFFQRQDISGFSPLQILVTDKSSPPKLLYNRTIFVEKLIFLDPPSNLTIQLLESPGQVNVSWQPLIEPHMESSMLYEVAIFREGYKAQREFTSKAFYLGYLKRGLPYTFAVRAKPNGISYDGYWSAWSQAVSVTVPYTALDYITVGLSLILVLIILILAFITLMFNRRFLKKKIWPAIPTPEHEFKDLFTIYKGNFQLWLGHQSTYLWWSQNPPYLEEQPFLVEILSECSAHKLESLPTPPPLPPKAHRVKEPPHSPGVPRDDYLVLDEDLVPRCPGREDSLFLLDSISTEGTDLVIGAGTPESSQNTSGFEYTVFDPSSKGLSSWGQQTEPQLKSSYQMVSDSGISADYSLVDSNAGPGSFYTNLCDGVPQPFVPPYIVCS